MNEKFIDFNMMEASFFESVTASASTKNLYDMLGDIQSGRHAAKISMLRECKDEEEKERIKRTFPSFTPSGVFSKSHRKDDLLSYNPMIVLDIDKVGLGKANELKQEVSKMETTFAAFISPSGNGLKILVKCDSTAETHEKVFQQLADHYESRLGIKIDRSGKDFSRLCFISYDPEIYLNDQSVPFHLTSHTEVPRFSARNVSVTTTDLFQKAVEYTESKFPYVKGQRNNYLFLLANNLNRLGASQTEALAFINSHYTDPDKVREIPGIIGRAYSHTYDHGKYSLDYISTATTAQSATTAAPITHSHTPFIPAAVYSHLPNILQKVTMVFDVRREKDIVLTSALTLLSGCFDQVTGLYDKKLYHANLFSFIIAPPASGKGVLNFSRELVLGVHRTIFDAYKNSEETETPIQRSLIIPADSSAAALKRLIRWNNEKGIICETEADTLSATLQQDWGGYSELLRNAFQHERVSFARIAKDKPVLLEEIEHPQLSICLSGTPSQVPSLLKSTEDGLFSRFMFYSFSNDIYSPFKNVFDKTGEKDLTSYFTDLSGKVSEYYNNATQLGLVSFCLTSPQEEEFVIVFNRMNEKLYNNFGDKTISIINRLGLITFRLAMILSILRRLDNNDFTSEIICDDIDFKSAILLSEVYLEHALDVYFKLDVPKMNQSTEKLFNILPDEFTYTQAVKLGLSIGIGSRSTPDYLKKLKEARLIYQEKTNGVYKKTKVQ